MSDAYCRFIVTPNLERRFWAKVDRRGPDECSTGADHLELWTSPCTGCPPV